MKQKRVMGKSGRFSTYMLVSNSIEFKNDIYVGYTCNSPLFRLRQHNGECQGGAQETCKKKPWNLIAAVTGFKSRKQALKFESCWQNPGSHKYFKQIKKTYSTPFYPEKLQYPFIKNASSWNLDYRSRKGRSINIYLAILFHVLGSPLFQKIPLTLLVLDKRIMDLYWHSERKWKSCLDPSVKVPRKSVKSKDPIWNDLTFSPYLIVPPLPSAHEILYTSLTDFERNLDIVQNQHYNNNEPLKKVPCPYSKL